MNNRSLPRLSRRMTALAASLFIAALLVPAILAAVLVAGCGPKKGTPEKPALTSATVRFGTPGGAGFAGSPDLALLAPGPGGARLARVATGWVEFRAALDTVPLDEWYAANVKVEGAEPTAATLAAGEIAFSFGNGPAGQRITITIDSIIPPEKRAKTSSFVVALERCEPAAATLEVRPPGGDWAPVKQGAVFFVSGERGRSGHRAGRPAAGGSDRRPCQRPRQSQPTPGR